MYSDEEILSAGGPRHLLHDACVSYTPSARMLCEVTARPPVIDGDIVLVGDPAENLYHCGLEAEALRESFYPKAKLLGTTGRVPASDGAGTPSEVAELLRNPVRMIHFGCHATAKVNAPHESYLELAGHADERHLAAGTLLDLNPTGELEIGLATLAGCTTSLSGADYDEALSLSSTFLAIGARSVIGSLWPVPQAGSTMHLTYQTNRHLAEGMRVADALRQAQLWMLDPDRNGTRDSLGLPGARSVRRDVAQWAAFMHMGS